MGDHEVLAQFMALLFGKPTSLVLSKLSVKALCASRA